MKNVEWKNPPLRTCFWPYIKDEKLFKREGCKNDTNPYYIIITLI